MDLLRVMTAGSVDDGKSTLIGRLFLEYGQIHDDNLESLGENGPNLAYFTDGLKEEREKGITIDVAYKYLETAKRKFIIADCPGHKEFTRNMVTGATSADLVLILVDAERGITEQTWRHTAIVSWLGKNAVYLLNKMDIVGYEKEVYDKFANRLTSFPVIPISALRGDNVLKLSQNMPWYQGHTVESLLHRFQPMHSVNKNIFFPVQYSFGNDVLGTLKTGVITVGSELKDSLNNQICKVQKIFRGLDEVPKGAGGEALRLVLTRSYERGDVLVSENTQKPPYFSFAIEWCQLAPGNQNLVIRYNTSEIIVSSLSAHEELELETGQWKKISGDIQINNIYRGIFRLQSSITFWNEEAALFDLKSGATVAAVLLKKGEE